MTYDCDASQINRVITNLLQNSADAIAGRDGPAEDLEKGQVNIDIFRQNGNFVIQVTDNGRGLPEKNRSRLTEPYVTHREKGTGLGLAIVTKIIEEHGGTLTMMDAPNGKGARVQVTFPTNEIRLRTGND